MCNCALVCGAEDAQTLPEFSADRARPYLEEVARWAEASLGTDAAFAYSLARVWEQLGQKQESERLARQSLERDQDRVEVQMFLARLLIHQDRMDEAAACLRRVSELKPDTPGLARQLGMVLDRLGDRSGAREVFEAGVRQTPGDATLRLLLGRLLLDEGQSREALVHLRKACELDASLSGSFYALSQAQAQLGDRDAAESSLKTFQSLKQQEAAALDGRNVGYDDEKFMRVLAAGFHTELAELLTRRGATELAEVHLRQAIRIAPADVQAYEALARLFLSRGKLAEARAVHADLTRLEPLNPIHRANLGTLLLQLQDPQGGEAELHRAIELDPVQPVALNNLTRYYLGSRIHLPEALELARRLVKAQPTAANYDLLGWASFANSLTNEAREAASQAVGRDPTNTVYRERLRRLQGPQ